MAEYVVPINVALGAIADPSSELHNLTKGCSLPQ